jgi:hypothetical protein
MSNLKELRAVYSRLVKDRRKAESEVRKIDSTIQKIEAAIADLQGITPKKERTSKTSKDGDKRAVGRRTWTEDQKKEAAERMKRIWAKKRKAKKANGHDSDQDASAIEASGNPRAVLRPQALA